MSATIILPRILQVGRNACEAVASVMNQLGCSRPLIITDTMMVQLGYVTRVQAVLEKAGLRSSVFADTVPEPTVSSIDAGVVAARADDFDCLLALGGGSPIDSAKAIAILARHGGAMRDYKFPRNVGEAGLPVIAIPTTAGTGSEMTRFTIITDDTVDEKMLCVGMGFLPVAALVDYTLSLSAPPRITADTGIDALTHAIEAYVSRKANAYSDSQALAAMRLLGPNLRRVFHDGRDEPAREAMMMGATLAGAAFSAASVALVHGMSRPIGAHFHVPHGLSNAMLLPSVTEFSIASAAERYAECARAMGIAAPGENVLIANRKLLQELRDLNTELQVPTPAGFGIKKDAYFAKLELMAEQAMASGSPGNNPRIPTIGEMISIYQSIWH
ncbi:iron-containing alcohol dehydrogenase [Ketobacter sp.]|uniref:iron-containing alcohol dehydrogenase n=1 Tax=Ketobacter sp. TaxID=2083498 RepID=UPI000F0EF708|nr:iron-containing alcohol dehydrogenase [Ketobacter sp.]RLT92085.1 MAG: iron-containing alcohol dehydrogenase [Ketobacter sp.]